MTRTTNAWDSLEIPLEWENEEKPTISLPVPLDLILLSHREAWRDSCPTMRIDPPLDLVAKSVPPPVDARSDRDVDGATTLTFTAARRAPDRRSVGVSALGVLSPALLPLAAFIGSATVTVALAALLHYALALGFLH